MTINVLHIWFPGYRNKFSGHYIYWTYAFKNWNEERIHHSSLGDYLNIIDETPSSNELAAGEHKGKRKIQIRRIHRFIWALSLIWLLYIHRNEYDLLHVHTTLWGGLLVGPWAKLLRKPAVLDSVLEGADNPSAVPNDWFGSIMLWCMRQFSMVIAISNPLTKDFLNNNISAVTIHNPVDSCVFSPVVNEREKKELRTQLGIPLDAHVCLFVGSIKYRKGVDILIKTFVRMAKKQPDLFLLLVGPNTVEENSSLDDKYIQDLYSLIKSNSLMARVKFAGLINDKIELSKYYKSADLFVLPTRHEGLPNVVLEAAASQLPIIVTSLPQLEEAIEDKINGLFFPIDDIDSFEQAIFFVLDNPNYAKKLASNAREFVVKNFTFKDWQTKISDCYLDLV